MKEKFDQFTITCHVVRCCSKHSKWLVLCAKVATFFYEIVSLKLKKSIGLDEFKKQKKMKTEVEPDSHNWSSMKSCFEGIIVDLKDLRKSTIKQYSD